MRAVSFTAAAALVLLAGCGEDTLAPRRDAAEDGQVRTGWIVGPGGAPMQVRFKVRDGQGILQGDIILGPVERIAKTREELELPARGPQGPSYGVVVNANRWSSPINYVISGTFTAAESQAIRDALVDISNRARGVVFHYGTASSYIEFVKDPERCESWVGRQGGRQVVKLAAGCVNRADVQHETLHALGFWHEQSRCDRDGYVEILWGNIIDDEEDNFDKHCTGTTDVRGYDEGSVMHYGPYAWGKVVNGTRLQTIRSLRGMESVMGRATSVNSTDVSTLNYLFAPPPPTYISGLSSPPVNSWQKWTVVPENGVTAASVQWYRDRVLVATTLSYETCVRGPMELLVNVTDVYGRFSQAYKMVYPDYYSSPTYPSYRC